MHCLMKEICSISDSLTRLLTNEEFMHLSDVIWSNHTYSVLPHQCSSLIVQRIDAPIEEVWSVVRRFDKPQAYKRFVRSCRMKGGDGKVGSIREVKIVSGIPASTSIERLEILDDHNRVISFQVLGGEHRLQNYRSVTTLHECTKDTRTSTVVLESYVVDIPQGNTKEDTCMFADTVVKCNLQSLAHLLERSSGRQIM